MQNTIEQLGSGKILDKAKWLVVVLLLVIGIYGNSHFVNDYSVYERALPLMLLSGIAIFIALKTVQGVAFAHLVRDSRAEIRRVVWPTRQEANHTTLVVAGVVLFMAIVLWALDWMLNLLVSSVIG